MSGVLAKKFGRKYCGSSERVSSVMYDDQLGLRVAPGEVGVGLAEAGLREQRHHRRARERLGQEHRLGVLAPAPRRSATPRTAIGLVCGLSTRNTVTPCATQCSTTSRSAAPERPPVLGVEVDVVDVLVALGRVLGVLERAVGPPVEPVGVLAQPGVVGRALDREVERDRDAELGGARGQARELRRAAEVGVQRRVPAGLAADRPRAARVGAARGRARCCGPCGASARSGGRAAGRARRSRASRTRAAASRRRRSRPTSAGRARTRSRTTRARCRPRSRASRSETVCSERSPAAAARPSSTVSDGDAEQRGALRELAREVALTGRDLALELVLPGGHAVDPRDDAELPAPERVGVERAVPAIEILGDAPHRRLAPAARPGRRGSAAPRRAPRGRRAGTSPTRRRARRACA